jgi:PPOX class probable F420-dependent enzyme
VWIDLDGEQVVFTTWHNTVKTSNMRRDPRLAICVDDQAPPFAFVSIEGTVTFSEDLEAVRYWATQIAGRYMGADLAQAYGQRNGVAGELLARVTPTRITAFKNISD